MTEVSDSREQAGDSVLFAQGEGLIIPLRAARVDQAVHAGVDQDLRSVRKREERIAGGDDRSPCSRFGEIAGLGDGEPAGRDPIHLARTGTEKSFWGGDADRVRFQHFDHRPGQACGLSEIVVGSRSGRVPEIRCGERMGVSFLREESAGNGSERQAFLASIVEGADREESAILPSFREECGGVIIERGG